MNRCQRGDFICCCLCVSPFFLFFIAACWFSFVLFFNRHFRQRQTARLRVYLHHSIVVLSVYTRRLSIGNGVTWTRFFSFLFVLSFFYRLTDGAAKQRAIDGHYDRCCTISAARLLLQRETYIQRRFIQTNCSLLAFLVTSSSSCCSSTLVLYVSKETRIARLKTVV